MCYICEYHMNTEYEIRSLRLDFMELMGELFVCWFVLTFYFVFG